MHGQTEPEVAVLRDGKRSSNPPTATRAVRRTAMHETYPTWLPIRSRGRRSTTSARSARSFPCRPEPKASRGEHRLGWRSSASVTTARCDGSQWLSESRKATIGARASRRPALRAAPRRRGSAASSSGGGRSTGRALPRCRRSSRRRSRSAPGRGGSGPARSHRALHELAALIGGDDHRDRGPDIRVAAVSRGRHRR